jgi:hypothetical protein
MNGAALAYEIGLPIRGDFIIWAAGGVPAGANPDITLARIAFTPMLRRDEKVLADKGYRDGNFCFITPNDDEHASQLSRSS